MPTPKEEWEDVKMQLGELTARDIMVRSICPEVPGLFPVKLAVALVLASGSTERRRMHLLMIGDAIVMRASRKMLRCAAEIENHTVHTNASGFPAACLTVRCSRDDDRQCIEPGALVLADGGLCCIEELTRMDPADRAGVVQAMKQQKISTPHGCSISARCSLLATANQPARKIDQALLGPFDVVFELRDIFEADKAVSKDLLAKILGNGSVVWTSDWLWEHFKTAKGMQPLMTDDATTMIRAYQEAYQNIRRVAPCNLVESLHVLAAAHAKLLLRAEINTVDVMVAIKLLESSFGGGSLQLDDWNAVSAAFPLGPTVWDGWQIRSMLPSMLPAPPFPDIDECMEDKLIAFGRKIAAQRHSKPPAPVMLPKKKYRINGPKVLINTG